MKLKSLGMLFLGLLVILFLFSLFKNTKEYMTTNWVEDANNYARSFDGNQSVDNYPGGPVPLPEGEMLIFANNVASPECCKQASFSSSNGCVCTTQAQRNYINERGGNRTAYGGTNTF
jgi:hypothetical protein